MIIFFLCMELNRMRNLHLHIEGLILINGYKQNEKPPSTHPLYFHSYLYYNVMIHVIAFI